MLPPVSLCPWREWEPRKGSRSTQGGYHPPYEEQSLAARSTWVSAHAMRNVLRPWYQACPPGTPLPPEVLIQPPAPHGIQPECPIYAVGQDPTPRRPLWLLCLGTGRQGPNFPTSTHSGDPGKKKKKSTVGSRGAWRIKEATRPVMFTSAGSARAGGKHSTSPFPFHQLQETF